MKQFQKRYKVVMDYLKDMKHTNDEEDSGFLYKETIYKLKGGA